MAGDAVAQSRAHAELVELAELLGAPVYTEFVPNTASFPTSHPLFRGSMIRLAPDVRKTLEQYDVLFSVGGDLFTLSLPSDVDPMPPGIDAHPPRRRSMGARQELSAQGRDPRRPEGHPARPDRRRARTHDAPAPAAARTTASRAATDAIAAERAALVARAKGARRRLAGAAARTAACHRRDAAEGCGGGRGGAVVGARHPPAHPQRRSAELFRPARRRHRLGPAGDHRREARAARPPGGRPDRRRQQHVHRAGAVDRGALQASARSSSSSTTPRTASSSSGCTTCAGSPNRPTAMWAWS